MRAAWTGRYGWLLRAGVTAIAVAAVAAASLAAGLFDGFRLQAADTLFPSEGSDERVVVVGIDEAALDEAGQRWPWSRSLQADLVRRLHAARPAVIALDVLYRPAAPDDGALASAIDEAGNVAVAAGADLNDGDGRLLSARTITPPVPDIERHATVGLAAITPDPIDGTVRSLPLAVETTDHRFAPSLSLATLGVLENLQGPITVRPGGVQLGNRYVPTDGRGRLVVNYTRDLLPSDRRSYISAADVLAGRVGREQVAGKAVFVGVADPALGDHHATPPVKAAGVPGVSIHAQALNTMLTRTYLGRVSGVETVVWVGALAALVCLVAQRMRLWVAVVAAVLAVTAYVLIAFVRFDRGSVMDLVYPPAATAVAFVATLALRYVTESGQRRRMATLLGQYVPADVARHLLDRDRAAGLPTGTITFLFTDVVGSTEAWEKYPRQMGEAMRCHDGLIEAAVERAGGALVRPRGEGDSRFAVFVRPDDAVAAAVDVERAMRSESWCTPEPVCVRIGVHTGEADLREGDYYGSPVNRCARIRSLASPGQVLLSEVTAEAVAEALPPDTELRDFGTHELKGMSEPEHVYEVALCEPSHRKGG